MRRPELAAVLVTPIWLASTAGWALWIAPNEALRLAEKSVILITAAARSPRAARRQP